MSYECVLSPPNRSSEDSSDWLLTDKVSSWPGTAADRAWRYLRQALERHDGSQSSFSYSKITLETILSFDRSSQSPPWLISLLEVRGYRLQTVVMSADEDPQEQHPEYLIRTYLRYEILDSAIECALSMLRKVRLIHTPSAHASSDDYCYRTIRSFRWNSRDLRLRHGYPTPSSTKYFLRLLRKKMHLHAHKHCKMS